MTTGRINQVANHYFPPWKKPWTKHCSRNPLQLRSPISVTTPWAKACREKLRSRNPLQLRSPISFPLVIAEATSANDKIFTPSIALWFCMPCEHAPKEINRAAGKCASIAQQTRSHNSWKAQSTRPWQCATLRRASPGKEI